MCTSARGGERTCAAEKDIPCCHSYRDAPVITYTDRLGMSTFRSSDAARLENVTTLSPPSDTEATVDAVRLVPMNDPALPVNRLTNATKAVYTIYLKRT